MLEKEAEYLEKEGKRNGSTNTSKHDLLTKIETLTSGYKYIYRFLKTSRGFY
jgi:hypothetical protein